MYRLLLILCLTLTVIPSSIFAQEQPRGIFATGSAEVRVEPDTAYVSLGVVTEAATAATAAQENATRTTQVIERITASGIRRADIQTTGYSISPILDYDQRPAVIVGYRVSNSVQVRLTDMSRIGAVLDAAVAVGANTAQGVRFTVDNDQAIRRQALAQAIDEAKQTAQAMADALGVRLGSVVSVSESGGVTPPPIVYGMARAEAASTPVLPGEVTVTANVTVNYAIISLP